MRGEAFQPNEPFRIVSLWSTRICPDITKLGQWIAAAVVFRVRYCRFFSTVWRFLSFVLWFGRTDLYGESPCFHSRIINQSPQGFHLAKVQQWSRLSPKSSVFFGGFMSKANIGGINLCWGHPPAWLDSIDVPQSYVAWIVHVSDHCSFKAQFSLVFRFVWK